MHTEEDWAKFEENNVATLRGLRYLHSQQGTRCASYKKNMYRSVHQPITRRQISDSSKLKELQMTISNLKKMEESYPNR